jgi:molecular chaperone HscB
MIFAHFTLFQLPVGFDIDLKLLQTRYEALQQQCHPDQFVQNGPQAQKVSTQMSTRVHQAYRILKEPLKRAQYLLEERGMSLADHATPQSLLSKQLLLWEEWESLTHKPAQKAYQAQLKQQQITLQHTFAVEYATNQYDKAQDVLQQWIFLARFEAQTLGEGVC